MSRLRLGRLPARHDDRTLRLGWYLTPHLPAPPPRVDNTAAVKRWPLYDNNRIADCTCATAGHMTGLWTTLAGRADWPSRTEVVAAYQAVSGYRPGEPDTDRGAVMLDVLRHWRKTGIGKHRIGAFIAVDHRNLTEVRTAIAIFGAVYAGALLPNAALTPGQAGHTWRLVLGPDGRPEPDNGHAFMVAGYDSETFGGATWGRPQRMTTEWWSTCVEESWAIASVDQLNASGRSPAGLDMAALTADLRAVTRT